MPPTSGCDRLLAWIGAIPHWIYPIALRRHAEAWRWLVIALSALGSVTCLAGLVLGVWNWLPRRLTLPDARRWPRSPYRKLWLRWHHYLGLAFGVMAFTWVFSGMLSLNPLRWSDGSGASTAERSALAGGDLVLARFRLSPAAALAACRREVNPREIELMQLAGRPFYLCRESPTLTRMVAADASQAEALRAFTSDTLATAARSLATRAPIVEATVVETGDDYHYVEPFARTGPPRVLRIKLGDRDRTWYYLDLATGSIAKRYTWRGRLERWLYDGLHCLAFPALTAHPALWRLTIVGLCGLGAALSVTSLGVTTGWLGRLRRRKRRDRGG